MQQQYSLLGTRHNKLRLQRHGNQPLDILAEPHLCSNINNEGGCSGNDDGGDDTMSITSSFCTHPSQDTYVTHAITADSFHVSCIPRRVESFPKPFLQNEPKDQSG